MHVRACIACVHSDFLDVVATLDADLLIGDEVLDDHIRHVVAVRIPLLATGNAARPRMPLGPECR